jgi:hypothetical protein
VPVLMPHHRVGTDPSPLGGDDAEPRRRPVASAAGLVLFVLARISKLSIERTPWRSCPRLIPLLASLVAITLIPS